MWNHRNALHLMKIAIGDTASLFTRPIFLATTLKNTGRTLGKLKLNVNLCQQCEISCNFGELNRKGNSQTERFLTETDILWHFLLNEDSLHNTRLIHPSHRYCYYILYLLLNGLCTVSTENKIELKMGLFT